MGPKEDDLGHAEHPHKVQDTRGFAGPRHPGLGSSGPQAEQRPSVGAIGHRACSLLALTAPQLRCSPRHRHLAWPTPARPTSASQRSMPARDTECLATACSHAAAAPETLCSPPHAPTRGHGRAGGARDQPEPPAQPLALAPASRALPAQIPASATGKRADLPRLVTATRTWALPLLQHLYSLPELGQACFLALDRFLVPVASASRTDVSQVQHRLLQEEAQWLSPAHRARARLRHELGFSPA